MSGRNITHFKMSTKIVIVLVALCIAYIDCKPTKLPLDDIKRNILNNQTFDELIEEILQQINSHQYYPDSEETQHPGNLREGPRINSFALKRAIFNSNAFTQWIQHVWDQMREKYDVLVGHTTRRPHWAPTSTTTAPEIIQSNTQTDPAVRPTTGLVQTTPQEEVSTTSAAEVVTSSLAQTTQETISSSTPTGDV